MAAAGAETVRQLKERANCHVVDVARLHKIALCNVCVCACVCVCLCVCVYVYVCVSVCVCVWINVHKHIYISMDKFICTHNVRV